MGHPEVAYRQAIAHWQRCPRCRQAGGEVALRSALCPVGQSLLDTWEDKEIAWARLRRERPPARVRLPGKAD